MRSDRMPLVCLAIPIAVAAMLLAVARSVYDRAARLRAENRSCRTALASIAPYLKQVSKYRMAEAYLAEHGGNPSLPELPMGVPAPIRASSRDRAGSGGWATVREEYSWNDMVAGQAFAVLAKFTNPDVLMWRIAALDLSCAGNAGKVSLSVTLESAERTQE